MIELMAMPEVTFFLTISTGWLNKIYYNEVAFFDLKSQSRLYEFLVQIILMDFTFDCFYINHILITIWKYFVKFL